MNRSREVPTAVIARPRERVFGLTLPRGGRGDPRYGGRTRNEEDGDRFSGVLRDPRHREHGGCVRRQPPAVQRGAAGPVTLLEGVYYAVGACSLLLGWYFNVRYVHLYGHRASYSNYVRMLFTNWAADSAAQDYTIVNLVLLPLWTITEGTRRGLRWAWIFFVMSLFTSLAFSVAFFLAFMERQLRYNRSLALSSTA